MFHWIADSRSGFVALLIAACIVAMAIYTLPALLAWSMSSPAGCNPAAGGHHSGGSAAGLDHPRLDCRPDLGDPVWEWREF